MYIKSLSETQEMVIYKPGSMSIQDVMKEDANGVLRTQCRGLTLKEYTLDGDGKDTGEIFVCIPFDEAVENIRRIEDEKLIKPFVEITEDEYTEMLECLPPEKWQTVDDVNIFRMSEYTMGNITGHYASYEGKYYMALRRTTVDYAEIAKEIKSITV